MNRLFFIVVLFNLAACIQTGEHIINETVGGYSTLVWGPYQPGKYDIVLGFSTLPACDLFDITLTCITNNTCTIEPAILPRKVGNNFVYMEKQKYIREAFYISLNHVHDTDTIVMGSLFVDLSGRETIIDTLSIVGSVLFSGMIVISIITIYVKTRVGKKIPIDDPRMSPDLIRRYHV